jgi:Raf kinase inhibitor-like YbhB/YbcL family protein
VYLNRIFSTSVLTAFFLSATLEGGMKITSTAFTFNQEIPEKYTCQGEDLSPPLKFEDIPKGAKSLALIVDDPDAPSGTFDHWIVWNIPPEKNLFEEGISSLPHQGRNHFGEMNYKGPCPPKGNAHRYFFKLYALDVMLNLPKGVSKQELEEAMEGHLLGKAELIGLYQRK